MDTTIGIIAGLVGAVLSKLIDLLIARMNKKDAQGKDIASNMTEQSRVLWDNQTGQILNLWKKLDETEDQLQTAQIAALETAFYKVRFETADKARQEAERKVADLEAQLAALRGTGGNKLPQAPDVRT